MATFNARRICFLYSKVLPTTKSLVKTIASHFPVLTSELDGGLNPVRPDSITSAGCATQTRGDIRKQPENVRWCSSVA